MVSNVLREASLKPSSLLTVVTFLGRYEQARHYLDCDPAVLGLHDTFESLGGIGADAPAPERKIANIMLDASQPA